MQYPFHLAMAHNFKLRWQQLIDKIIDDLVHTSSTHLQGIQSLSKKYSISRTSIEQALKHLEEIQLILPAEAGKRRKINQATLKKLASHRGISDKRVIFLSMEPLHVAPHLTEQSFREIRKLLAAQNIHVEYVTAPVEPPVLRKLLRDLSPDGVFEYVIPNELSEVIVELNIPAVGMGVGHPEVSSFNINYEMIVSAAFNQAWQNGHKRAIAPLWNKNLEIQQHISTHIKRTTPASSGTFSSSYHLPLLYGSSAADYHSELSKLYALTPPSCLILGNFSQYLMASSYLQKIGKQIPEDTSIILLSYDPQQDFIHPPLSYYSSDNQSIVTRAVHTLTEVMKGVKTVEKYNITPKWNSGGSLKAY